MKTIELRNRGRFQLTIFEPYDDGSVNLVITDPGKPKYLIDAVPNDGGFDVYKFNRETGVMDLFFILNIELETDERGVPSPYMVSKLFENCVFYLEGNHVPNMANIKVEMGDRVVCDYCNEDFTNSKLQGGFLFGSYATCPNCAPRALRDAKKYGELNRITKTCPEGMTFKEFVLTLCR